MQDMICTHTISPKKVTLPKKEEGGRLGGSVLITRPGRRGGKPNGSV